MVTKDPALEGTASVDFTSVTGTYVGRIYVQGRAGNGSTSLSAQASEYTAGGIAVDVSPSGFIFGNGDFSTTIYSPDTPLTLYSVRLETGTLQVRDYEAVRGGLTVDVPVRSAFPTIGAITDSPATFNRGDGA